MTGGQGVGSTSVPQSRTQVVPASGFCLFPIYLVSGFPPSASGPSCSRKASTSSPYPWVPNNGSGQDGLLEMPSRIKTPAEPHSDCVALGKRLEFSEPQFPLPVNLGGEVGHLRAY